MSENIRLFRCPSLKGAAPFNNPMSQYSRKLLASLDDRETILDEGHEKLRAQVAISNALGLDVEGIMLRNDVYAIPEIDPSALIEDVKEPFGVFTYSRLTDECLQEQGMMTLEEIFNTDARMMFSDIFNSEDETTMWRMQGYIFPRWEKVLEHAEKILNSLYKEDCYSVETLMPSMVVASVGQPADAVKLYKQAKEENNQKSQPWSRLTNNKGQFYFGSDSGILAIIPGNKHLSNLSEPKARCFYVIRKSSGAYLIGEMEKVRKTCELVIRKHWEEECFFRWQI